MAVHCEPGATIEGAKCEIYSRKENFKGLRQDPITKQPMVTYELSRNCSMEISRELPLSDDERNIPERAGVYLSLGEKIKGESITMYVEGKGKVSFDVKEGMTARHGGRLLSTSKRTIGVIKYPFDNLRKKLMSNSTFLIEG